MWLEGPKGMQQDRLRREGLRRKLWGGQGDAVWGYGLKEEKGKEGRRREAKKEEEMEDGEDTNMEETEEEEKEEEMQDQEEVDMEETEETDMDQEWKGQKHQHNSNKIL